MTESKTVEAINIRYSELAETSCCLSCGGAINHSKVKPGDICVDLGSGRGNDVLRMAEEIGPEGFAWGIDISDGMLKKAEKTAARLGVKNAGFKQSQLENLPLEENTADLVISNCTINHAADKQLVWNEVYRILKKGGRFVVSDIFSTAPVPEKFHNDPEAVAECWAGSVTRSEYETQLKKAGFSNIQILEESKPYPKGSIEVVSWTIAGSKPAGCC